MLADVDQPKAPSALLGLRAHTQNTRASGIHISPAPRLSVSAAPGSSPCTGSRSGALCFRTCPTAGNPLSVLRCQCFRVPKPNYRRSKEVLTGCGALFCLFHLSELTSALVCACFFFSHVKLDTEFFGRCLLSLMLFRSSCEAGGIVFLNT
ncbi:uncharacterized protein B0I36DRAFT_63001 [Microdochium trichocladiopsis]|uniref:Uncharacterized protein n=1 Tax=Microdochium trichocladiopsis TaxID=1682393 RepID=A0A9P8YDG4_9PEZI|nr:uncharacterized protein B0I36DRAFT_63001 [Microdochium trichocladiopsis]KAH7037219.1 hypothetical protein B0I36DRAFT_63001 [Microdochium trichocladiopsis]